MTTFNTSLTSGIIALLLMAPAAHGKARKADFNGDGVSDLAISVPGERVGVYDGAGAVAVLYGRDGDGLDDAGDQFWTQDSSGINNSPSQGDAFGGALAWGDFDDDGFTDLAIGIPGEVVNGLEEAGAVAVLYGSSHGLTAQGDQFWHRDVQGVNREAEAGAQFGVALAAGDFDGDGFSDLAIGVMFATVNTMDNAGEVHVLYGTSHGLSAQRDRSWNQDSSGIVDDPEANDCFGASLTAGDFDSDERDDLAIGVPLEEIGGALYAGAVHVLYGSPQGLSDTVDQFLYQGAFAGAILGEAEALDIFGYSVQAGDFDGNGCDDLAVGVPGEDDSQNSCGAVHVIYGTQNGLGFDDEIWTQDSDQVPNQQDAGDMFGMTLASGDFDRNGRDDLAISVPEETISNQPGAGAVQVLYGTQQGLDTEGNQFWHQDSTGIKDACFMGESFGLGMTCGDFDDDGRDDLAVSVPGESINNLANVGVVNVIYGKNQHGLHRDGNQLWHQDAGSINDSAQEYDSFGRRLIPPL